jgi:hypothetical protein
MGGKGERMGHKTGNDEWAARAKRTGYKAGRYNVNSTAISTLLVSDKRHAWEKADLLSCLVLFLGLWS